MTETLLSLFPDPDDLLSLEAEELGGVVLELASPVMQNGLFNISGLVAQVSQSVGPSYPSNKQRAVTLALAEAVSWLVTQGLMVEDPQQNRDWYVFTRRGQSLQVRADVEAYRKGRVLPVELLQPALAKKVRPQFLRGIMMWQCSRHFEKWRSQSGWPRIRKVLATRMMLWAFH